MKLLDVYSALCVWDRRNPNGAWKNVDKEENIPDPREDCGCDSCHYGRDRLAMEIIKLREACSDAVDAFELEAPTGNDVIANLKTLTRS